MNDLTTEELKQLLVFYKQKSSDIEFELLKTQLMLNRVSVQKTQTETKNKKSE
jgi:hypothetical protein